MLLNVVTYARAVQSPLLLPEGWDDDNLRFCVATELRERIVNDGVSLKEIEHPIDRFEELILNIERTFVNPLAAPYHDADHARSVARRFVRYLKADGAIDVVQNLGLLAGLFHDAGHPGERYREDAAYPGLSNEEFAAASCVTYLQGRLNTSQLAWLWSVIIATSFGQRLGRDTEVNAVLEARPHLVRPYSPVTEAQQLLHLADINCTEGPDGYEQFILGGVKFTQELARGAAI